MSSITAYCASAGVGFVGGGTATWTSDTNIENNTGFAQAALGSGNPQSKTIDGYNFFGGNNVPSGVTIDGLVVTIGAKLVGSSVAATINGVNLQLNGHNGQPATNPVPISLTSTVTTYTFGSSTDLWTDAPNAGVGGTTISSGDWTVSNVNSSTEGTGPTFSIAADRTLGTLDVDVQAFQGTIYYSASTPTAPTGVSVSPISYQSVQISGTDPSGFTITDHHVQVATNSAMTGATTVDTGQASFPLTVNGLSAGTQYWFEVAADDSAGTGAYSSPAVTATTFYSFTIDPSSDVTIPSGWSKTGSTYNGSLNQGTDSDYIEATLPISGNLILGSNTTVPSDCGQVQWIDVYIRGEASSISSSPESDVALYESNGSTALASSSFGGGLTTSFATVDYSTSPSTAGDNPSNWSNVEFSIGVTAGASGETIEYSQIYAVVSYSLGVQAVDGSYSLTGESAGLFYGRVLPAAAASFALTGEAVGLFRGYDVTASYASFVATAEPASLLWAHVVDAADATFSLTGEAVGLSLTLNAAAASFSLTAESAGLSATRLLNADAASFSFTGESVGLDYGQILNASAASFSLSGEAVNFLRGYQVNASIAQFIENGAAVDLLYGHLVPATYSVFTLTGFDSEPIFTLAASPAMFGLTGQPVELLVSHVLPAEVASFAFTGENVTLSYPFLIAASPASFSLTAESAGLAYGRNLHAVDAQFNATAEPVGLLYGRLVVVNYASFVTAGESVNFVYDRKLDSAAAVFTVTAKPAGLLHDHIFHAPAVAFDLTGNPANFRRTYEVKVGVGQYVETAEPAALLHDHVLSAQDASISLDGKPATLGIVMEAEPASFGLTAEPAALLYARVFHAAPATFAETADPDGLLADRKLQAGVATFGLTGKASGLLKGYSLVASAAEFSERGEAVGLYFHRLLVTIAGVFIENAKAVALNHNRVLFAEPAAFTENGQSVQVTYDRNLAAGVAAFSITGQAVSFKGQWRAYPGVVVFDGPYASNVEGGARCEIEPNRI